MSAGSLSAYEKALVGSTVVTITVVRSNFYLSNIDVRREIIDYEFSAVFLFAVYLQNLKVDIEYVTFNVTGILFVSPDPLNLRLEHIIVDAYALRNGIVFRTLCNYPEAALTNEVIVNNYTVVTSSDRKFTDNPSMFYYAGPGNVTASNLNFNNHYVTTTNFKVTFVVSVTADCRPNDGSLKVVNLQNATYSLPSNPYGLKFSMLAFEYNANLYRKAVINVTNQTFFNVENIPMQLIIVGGLANEEINFSNFKFYNISSNIGLVSVYYVKKVSLQNFTFSGIIDKQDIYLIYVAGSQSVEMNSIMIENINGTASSLNPLLLLGNYPFAFTRVSQLTVNNCYLRDKTILANSVQLDSFKIENGVYSKVYQTTGATLFSTGRVKQLIFTNHTFNEIKSLDASDESSRILTISVLDLNSTLNSTINDIRISNSESAVLAFASFINLPSNQKKLQLSNLSYIDSKFSTSKSLISTDKIEIKAAITLQFENLAFSNIEFALKGSLLYFGHHLPEQVVVLNSTFTNLTSASIWVEASNKQNTELSTRVRIENSVFDTLSEKTNSLVNIYQGGDLQIANCTFRNVMSFEEGAIIFAGREKTTTVISDSSFYNNTAVKGTVFYIESQSVVECHTCTIYNNFGYIGTVVVSNNNGYFRWYNSRIFKNYGVMNSVANLFDSATTSVINHCEIYENVDLTLTRAKEELQVK